MSPRKVIVTVAPTGGMGTKQQNPNLPTQPEEIAEQVARCRELGASIAAIHARRPDDAPTCDPEIYRRINELIRERSDIIINNSTGGGIGGDMTRELGSGLDEISFEERLKGLEAGAEMAASTVKPRWRCSATRRSSSTRHQRSATSWPSGCARRASSPSGRSLTCRTCCKT